MKALTLASIAALTIASFAAPAIPATAAQAGCNLTAIAYVPCTPKTPMHHEVATSHVCFYIDTDYSDRNFCEAGTRTVNLIRDTWKHSIESIQIAANSQVRVCSEPNMKGTCHLYGDNVRELGPEVLNHVYSYRTEQVRW